MVRKLFFAALASGITCEIAFAEVPSVYSNQDMRIEVRSCKVQPEPKETSNATSTQQTLKRGGGWVETKEQLKANTVVQLFEMPKMILEVSNTTQNKLIDVKTHSNHCNQFTGECWSSPRYEFQIVDDAGNDLELISITHLRNKIRPGEAVEITFTAKEWPVVTDPGPTLKVAGSTITGKGPFGNESEVRLRCPS